MEQATADRRRLLHSIGNLTLLNDRLNPLVSDGPWVAEDGQGGKRRGIADHSVLHLNHRVCECRHWTERAIVERSEELFALARAIWPRPDAHAAMESA